jgi:hypothetical protein
MLSPNQGMHKVVNDLAQSHVGVSCYLEFNEPGVIAKASIAKPVNEVIGAAFLGNECYGNTRLRKESNDVSIESGEGSRDVNSHRRQLKDLLLC